MSNATGRNISANDRPFAIIFGAGLAAAAVQTLFLREYLSVFSGNEIVIGIIMALWLCATALGSLIGTRISVSRSQTPLVLAYFFSIIAGLLAMRAVRLLYGPGEAIPPLMILITVLCTQSLPAVFGGFFFSRLSQNVPGDKLYAAENAGAAAGLSVVSLCILMHLPNGFIVAAALAAMAFIAIRSPLLLSALALVLLVLVLFDPVSVRWKYSMKVQVVSSGQEGEIAESEGRRGDAALTLLNNTIYRADMTVPTIEQSVHIPVAMHGNKVERALVIGNNGQVAELRKYENTAIECLESEPLLTTGICRCAAAETYKGSNYFDVVLLGGGFPETVGRGRFFTLSFFKKAHSLTGDQGVFSFTLPFSENYLSPPEKRLKDMLQVTLGKVFRNVRIIPGSGYTFVASDAPLLWPVHLAVTTAYLEAYTLASLSPGRMAEANRMHDPLTCNTLDKPLALVFTQERWLKSFGVPAGVFGCVLAGLFLLVLPVLARTRAAFSVGTSGFVVGVYSVALLLLYQAVYGTLYSRISLLLIALSIGFALGGRWKKIWASDAVIAVYAAGTLFLMTQISSPPLVLFLLLHAGIGFLAGAQFATRKVSSWGGLYAADLVGGVFGMALCGTVLLPLFGITAIAAGLGGIKMVSAVVAKKKLNTSTGSVRAV